MKAFRCVLLASWLAVPTAAAQQPAVPAPEQAAPAPLAPLPAPAPPGPDPQPTPQQRAALQKQDAEMSDAAQQVLELVDAGRIGEVWDGASAVMKRVVPREEFVNQVSDERGRLGRPVDRGTAGVTRTQFPAGARVPQGMYVNVATPTRFQKSAGQVVRELVSFRLDEDRVWRVSGYSVR